MNTLLAPAAAVVVVLLAWQGVKFLQPPLPSVTQDSLPVIDLAALRARAPGALESLALAARGIGMARLVNHGADVEAARASAKAYFALPEEAKGCTLCSRRNASDGFQRGYIPFASESGSAEVLEVKEGFCYGYEWPEDRQALHSYQSPNVWPLPSSLEALGNGWQTAMMAFFNATIAASQDIVAAFEELLSSRGDGLMALIKGGETISQMRLFHYLPASVDSSKPCMGSSPHTDWHAVTIISRDAASSFQYLDSNGEWRDAAVGEDELLLLVGDWLSMFSGGEFHSAAHRVLPPSAGQSSISFVLFFYPSAEARLPPASAKTVRQSVAMNTVDDSMLELPWGEYVVQKWAKVLANR